jgi:hypothetical protein
MATRKKREGGREGRTGRGTRKGRGRETGRERDRETERPRFYNKASPTKIHEALNP